VITLADRRSAYRVNSRIWGVRAETQLKCSILQPGSDPDKIDIAMISAYTRLQRLRPDASLAVSYVRVCDDAGNVFPGSVREPLDTDVTSDHGIALMRKYCSTPVPTFRVIEAEDGFVRGEITPNEIGNRGELTYVEGNVTWNAAPRYRNNVSQISEGFARVHIPCKALLFDTLIHRDTYDEAAVHPEMRVYAEHGGQFYPSGPVEPISLPMNNDVAFLGHGLHVCETPRFPCYGDVLSDAFRRLGTDPDAYRVHRCLIEYPIMPTSVSFLFDLPAAPDRAAESG